MTASFPATTWRHARSPEAAGGKVDLERRGRWRVCFAIAGFGLLYGVLAARLVVGVEQVVRVELGHMDLPTAGPSGPVVFRCAAALPVRARILQLGRGGDVPRL